MKSMFIWFIIPYCLEKAYISEEWFPQSSHSENNSSKKSAEVGRKSGKPYMANIA
jgi:hypothetical protein